MRALSWVVIGVVGVVILLAVAILAGQVGGIAIRKQGAKQDPLQLLVSEPVVRGVPVMVRWDAAVVIQIPNEVVTFFWRDQTKEYRLGETQLDAGSVTVQFPCVAQPSGGSLVVRSTATAKVIGSRNVELAPAGPECI
jgi:hypothetical protein